MALRTRVAIVLVFANVATASAAAALSPVSQDRRIEAAITGQTSSQSAPAFDPFDDTVNLFFADPTTCMCGMQGGASQVSSISDDGVDAWGEALGFVLSSGVPLLGEGESTFEVVFDLTEPHAFDLSGYLTPLACEFVAPVCLPGAVEASLERLSPSPEILFSTSSGGSFAEVGELSPGRYRARAATSTTISGVVYEESRSRYAYTLALSPLPALVPTISPFVLALTILVTGLAAASRTKLDTRA